MATLTLSLRHGRANLGGQIQFIHITEARASLAELNGGFSLSPAEADKWDRHLALRQEMEEDDEEMEVD